MGKYEDDRKWADAFIPEIKRVLRQNAPLLMQIEISSAEADMKEATDLNIRTKAGRVACRIRRSDIGFRDWTIRYSRPNGIETEYSKIKNGFADFYLYAWAAKDGKTFQDWILLDLDRVRINDAFARGNQKANTDGTVFWYAPARSLCDCLLASSMQLPTIPDDPDWYDENAPLPDEEYEPGAMN